AGATLDATAETAKGSLVHNVNSRIPAADGSSERSQNALKITFAGHITDGRRNVVTECLKRIRDDHAAYRVMLALDFCSFGAFGDFAEFEQQARLIKSIAHRLYDKEGSFRIVANAPGACQWQLEQFFAEPEWKKNGGKWKE